MLARKYDDSIYRFWTDKEKLYLWLSAINKELKGVFEKDKENSLIYKISVCCVVWCVCGCVGVCVFVYVCACVCVCLGKGEKLGQFELGVITD